MNKVIRKGRVWVEIDENGKELKRSMIRFEPSKPKKKAAPKKKEAEE